MSVKKEIEIIVELIKATQRNKCGWKPYNLVGLGVRYSFYADIDDKAYFVISVIQSASPELRIYSKKKELLFEFKKTQALEDLLSTIQSQIFDLDKFLERLKEITKNEN